MQQNAKNIALGIVLAGFGALLFLVIIPNAVITPKNVRIAVLSPAFWPNIVAGLIVIGSLILVAQQAITRRIESNPIEEMPTGSTGRILALAVMMVAYFFIIPVVGMVWTSIAAFIAFAIIVRTKRYLPAIIVGVVLPFVLYAFFSHVAGVPVPQGQFVRLP